MSVGYFARSEACKCAAMGILAVLDFDRSYIGDYQRFAPFGDFPTTLCQKIKCTCRYRLVYEYRTSLAGVAVDCPCARGALKIGSRIRAR